MFQRERNNHNQTPEVGVVPQHAPEKCITKVLLNKKQAESIDINLMKFVMINSQ